MEFIFKNYFSELTSGKNQDFTVFTLFFFFSSDICHSDRVSD